jgi:hypothetical protein
MHKPLIQNLMYMSLILSTAAIAFDSARAQSKTKSAPTGAERVLGESLSVLSLDKVLKPMPPDRASISSALAQLKNSSHAIQSKAPGPKTNPVMQFLTVNPQKSLGAIEKNFQKGETAQTAHEIRRQMQFCAECHASGTKPNWAALQPVAGLTLIELADFYKFTGRPNDAILYYEKILTTRGTAASRPDIWERAAANIVAIGIESTGSPYTYVDVMSNLLQETVISKSQRDLVTSWRAAGKSWGQEAKLPTKANELLDASRNLIMTADNMNRVNPLSGLSHQARAMHNLRRVQTIGTLDQKTKAFLMAGELREKVSIPGVWVGAEDFYEACIRANPHSADGTRCWSQLSSLSSRDPRFSLDAETNQQLQALLR